MAEPKTSGGGAGPPIVLPTRIAGKARSVQPATNVDSGQPLRSDRNSPANTSIASMRNERTAPALMRTLAESNGLASTALLNLMSMADSGFALQAYTTWTQEFSREGLQAAETVISALDTNWDYSKGYLDRRSVPSLVESALWDVAQTGGIGLELVLDTFKVPRNIVLFPYDQVTWISAGQGRKWPQQKPAQGDPVDLNQPTIFVGESVKSVDRNYTVPFTASGAQRLIHYESFIEDMQRILKRAGEPRITAQLMYDKIVQSAPPDTQGDPAKLSAYLDQVRVEAEKLLSGLAPEDALVFYDLMEIDKIDSAGEKKDFQALLQELSGQAASALKSNASMMGMRAGGSQNVAGTEAMIALKTARRLQLPVEEVMSRALTLAVRLYGVDAYIKFRFKPINLRPEEELAAHRSMDQNRVLELLSWGRVTDDEAQILLGLNSLPEGAKELSGTEFYESKPADTAPASGTNARNANVTPPGKSSAGGKDNAQRP